MPGTTRMDRPSRPAPVVPHRGRPLLGTVILPAVLVVYAVLLLVGGFIGYRKAGSRPSLIAGSISGLVALLAAGLMRADLRAVWLGIVLAAGMIVVFSIRFARTRKFMPSGMLGALSAIVLVVLLVGDLWVMAARATPAAQEAVPTFTRGR